VNDLLLLPAPLLWTGVVLVGLCVGSFLNVVIHRLPIMMQRSWKRECEEISGTPSTAPATTYNLIRPRSACPHCQRPIRCYENLPLVSWLMLRGRCAGCQASISARYPLVELLGAALAVLAMARFGFSAQGLAACLLLWTLLALTFIDIDTMMLPDNLTLPLLWGGLAFNFGPGGFASLPAAVAGAMAGYLSLWSIYWLFKLIRGKEGMGYGDFKLFAALGAWLGAAALLPIIILAAVLGAVWALLAMTIVRRSTNQPMPFGPWLALGGATLLLAKPWLPVVLLPLG
jgi:leader peptidase (prepilin peptidase)/N-methyltransferase